MSEWAQRQAIGKGFIYLFLVAATADCDDDDVRRDGKSIFQCVTETGEEIKPEHQLWQRLNMCVQFSHSLFILESCFMCECVWQSLMSYALEYNGKATAPITHNVYVIMSASSMRAHWAMFSVNPPAIGNGWQWACLQ